MAALDRLSEITNWHEFIEIRKKLSSRVFQGWNKLFSHQSGVSKDLRILQRLCQDSALHCFDLGSDINGHRADTLPLYHLDCIPVYLCYSEMLSEYWPESGCSLPCNPLSTQQNSLLETIGSHMDCILSIKDVLSPKERERLLVGCSVLQSVVIDKDFEGIFRSSRMIDGSISNATCLDGKLQEVLDAQSKLQDAVQAVKEELYPLFPASQGVPPQSGRS